MARRGIKTNIDQGKRFAVNNFVAKGKFVPKHLEKWERASNYIGENYSDYYVVYAQSRDSDLLTKSNFDVLEEEFDGKEGVEIVRFGSWATGWVEYIMIHEEADDLLMKADDYMEQLENYPVLDEEDFSQREYDATIENIKWEGGLEEEEAKEVFSWLWDYDQDQVEAHDGGGGYPSKESIEKALTDLSRRGKVIGEAFEWMETKYGKNAIDHFKDTLTETDWMRIEAEDPDWRSDVVKEIFKERKDTLKLHRQPGILLHQHPSAGLSFLVITRSAQAEKVIRERRFPHAEWPGQRPGRNPFPVECRDQTAYDLQPFICQVVLSECTPIAHVSFKIDRPSDGSVGPNEI